MLDTGIDLAHSQFGKLDDAHPENGTPRSRVRRCVSFVDGQNADHDTSGHGTHCAALLLALAPGAHIYVGGSSYSEPAFLHKDCVLSRNLCLGSHALRWPPMPPPYDTSPDQKLSRRGNADSEACDRSSQGGKWTRLL